MSRAAEERLAQVNRSCEHLKRLIQAEQEMIDGQFPAHLGAHLHMEERELSIALERTRDATQAECRKNQVSQWFLSISVLSLFSISALTPQGMRAMERVVMADQPTWRQQMTIIFLFVMLVGTFSPTCSLHSRKWVNRRSENVLAWCSIKSTIGSPTGNSPKATARPPARAPALRATQEEKNILPLVTYPSAILTRHMAMDTGP